MVAFGNGRLSETIHIENTVQHMKHGRTLGMVINEGGHYTGVLLYHTLSVPLILIVTSACPSLSIMHHFIHCGLFRFEDLIKISIHVSDYSNYHDVGHIAIVLTSLRVGRLSIIC